MTHIIQAFNQLAFPVLIYTDLWKTGCSFSSYQHGIYLSLWGRILFKCLKVWADARRRSCCLRIGSKVCKSTASDSCRVGKAFLVISCFSKGNWYHPSKNMPNKMPTSEVLFSSSEGEFQRDKGSSILLSANPFALLEAEWSWSSCRDLQCLKYHTIYCMCFAHRGTCTEVNWSSRWEDTRSIIHSGSGLFWRCICFCNYFSH